MAEIRKPLPKPGSNLPDDQPPRLPKKNDLGPPGQAPTTENHPGPKKSGTVADHAVKGVTTRKPG